MIKNTLACAFLVLLIFSACEKKTDGPGSPPDTRDIEMLRITAEPWTMYKVELSGQDIWNMGFIDQCQKDDTYRFYANKRMVQYENRNVCSGNTDSSENEWDFYNGRKSVIGSILGITDTAQILELEPK